MSRQINIRVEEDVFAVISAAAFVNDISPPDVVRDLLESRVAELEQDSEVKDALGARRRKAAKKRMTEGAAVTSLGPRRKGRVDRG